MIKIRIQFSKSGPLRFIGHLDFLKVFQQTVSRAKLPIAYSQGFHPHMLLSFALPLPLGMTSLCDYADLTLESDLPEDAVISQINTHAPSGLSITNAYKFNGPGAAAIVTAADYLLETDGISCAIIQNLLNHKRLNVSKKTKSGIKDADIRPDIYNIWQNTDNRNAIMKLAAGSARFLNPLIVAGLLLGHDVDPSAIVRSELYRQDDKKGLVSLNEAPIH